MSKLIDRIKKLILKPFPGEEKRADAKKPDPLPPPIKPKEGKK